VEEQNQTAGDPEMSDICGCGQEWAMDKDMDMDARIESGGCQIFNSIVNLHMPGLSNARLHLELLQKQIPTQSPKFPLAFCSSSQFPEMLCHSQ